MKSKERKNEHYSNLKMALRIVTLIVAVWALVVAYQAKQVASWIDSKQNNVIEKLMFNQK